MFNVILKFITSEKFYLPVMFIALGVISFEIISKTIRKVNNINERIGKISKVQHSKGYDKRKYTVIVLINNIIKYIIAIIVIIAILNVYGVNTSNIMASIGIASAVIGLAFQDIIKDFLSGIFIIFDNAYAVGDWITIDGFKGEVIAIGLRTTKIKAYTGEVMSLSNSSFSKVINYNLEKPKLYLKIPFSYEDEIKKVEEVLTNVLNDIKSNSNVIKTELLGVDDFEESCINYAIAVDCKPNTQVLVKRILLRDIKLAFDENKITIPYNQLDVHIDK